VSDGTHGFHRSDLLDELESPAELLLHLLQGLAKELPVLLRDFFHCAEAEIEAEKRSYMVRRVSRVTPEVHVAMAS